MKDAGEALVGLLVGLILIAIFLVYTLGGASKMVCPEPVYAQGRLETLSCNGHVTLVTPTPAEVKR